MTHLAHVHGFTRGEWFKALTIDTPDEDAAQRVAEMFAQHEALGSDGFVFEHRDMLRLAYVNEDCRSRVLVQIADLGKFGSLLLQKLRAMDRDMRTKRELRHAPASAPL